MSIASLKIGEVLSDDVCIANGRKLFASGHIVTKQTLRVLKIWGVRNVSTLGTSDSSLYLSNMKVTESCAFSDGNDALQMLYIFNDTKQFPVSVIVDAAVKLKKSKNRKEDYFFKYLAGVNSVKQNENVIPVEFEENTAVEMFFEYENLPELFHSIVKMLNDIYVTPNKVSELLEAEGEIKYSVLDICRALIDVSDSNIASIYDCASVLGSRIVLYVAIMLTYVKHTESVRPTEATAHYGKSAIATAVAARIIADRCGVYGLENVFSCGLFRYVGSWYFYNHFTEAYAAVRQRVVREREQLCVVEKEMIGLTHSEMGSLLLKHNGFPSSIEKSVAKQHCCSADSEDSVGAVLHLSEFFAKAFFYHPDYDPPAPEISVAALQCLNITGESLTELFEAVYHKSVEVIRLAYGE